MWWLTAGLLAWIGGLLLGVLVGRWLVLTVVLLGGSALVGVGYVAGAFESDQGPSEPWLAAMTFTTHVVPAVLLAALGVALLRRHTRKDAKGVYQTTF